MLTLREIPKDIQFMKYDSDGCEFAFPEGARFVRFERAPDRTQKVRMVYKDPKAGTLRIEFEYPCKGSSAQQAAEESAGQKHMGIQLEGDPIHRYNLAPEPLIPERQDAWRLRWGWRDPAYPPLINDVTFIQLPTGLYKITFREEPQSYEECCWVLDTMLRTFRASGSTKKP